MHDARARLEADLDQMVAEGRDGISALTPEQVIDLGMTLNFGDKQDLMSKSPNEIETILFFASIGLRQCLLGLSPRRSPSKKKTSRDDRI